MKHTGKEYKDALKLINIYENEIEIIRHERKIRKGITLDMHLKKNILHKIWQKREEIARC